MGKFKLIITALMMALNTTPAAQDEAVGPTRTPVIEGQTQAYEIETRESDEIKLGETQVLQEGKEGFVVVTKEVLCEDGEVKEENVLEERVISEPVTEIVLEGTAGVAAPLDNMNLTSGFGARWGRQHEGVDLSAPEGTPVHAAKSGTVSFAGYSGGYGYLVKIDHGEGLETYYAHCSQLIAAEGQAVELGEIVALSGSTGNSTGPHLHFEVRVGGVAQNPMDWL